MAAAAAASAPEEAKTIYLIRHGVTEMNVYLSINNWARSAAAAGRRRSREGAPFPRAKCRLSGAHAARSAAALVVHALRRGALRALLLRVCGLRARAACAGD